jgi:hypothetical protein
MVPTYKTQFFPLYLHWMELQFSDFCCDKGIPDRRDAQAGLTDRMVLQRCVDGFLVFPVCGVWFNLQDFCFFQTVLWSYSYSCCANFDFSSRPVRLCLCSVRRTSTDVLVSPM